MDEEADGARAAPTGDTATDEPAPGHVSRNVKVLSWVSFFQDSASEMLYPVLPIFLTTVIGAPVAVVGIIEGIAEGTASVMKAVAGRLADLRKRRPLVAGGYGLSSIAKLLIGFATGWPLILFARFTDRLGKGLRGPPRDAMIASGTTEADRGRAFGFHRAADTAGAVVGPLVGLGLYELLGQEIRPLFFVAFIPATISVALIFLVHERPHRVDGDEPPVFSLRGFPVRYWRLTAFLGVFAFVNFTDALLILRARYLGLGFAAVILVYVLYNLSYAMLSYPAGVLSDRIPRRVVFAIGLIVFAGRLHRPWSHHQERLGLGAPAPLRLLHGAHRRGQPRLGRRHRPEHDRRHLRRDQRHRRVDCRTLGRAHLARRRHHATARRGHGGRVPRRRVARDRQLLRSTARRHPGVTKDPARDRRFGTPSGH